MPPEFLNPVNLAGLIAIVGAFVYAVGDVLMLAGKVDMADYPNLQAHLKLLSGVERMAGVSKRRLMWGGLLGVFAPLLVMAGYWQVYRGLSLAGANLATPPIILFVSASVVGAFVHGSFIYAGEYVQALNAVSADSQSVLIGMFKRLKTILIITYPFLFVCIIAASVWYSAVVASGRTAFPNWMAAVNPVTAFGAWLIVKKILPSKAADATEGAGFNIAFLIFFVLTTWTLWGKALA